MTLHRRRLLAGVAGVLGGPSEATGRSSQRIEIGVTPTRDALSNGSEPIMLACQSIERAVGLAAPAAELCVGPHGIVDVPADALASAGDAVDYWQGERPRHYADAELLVCSAAEAAAWDLGGKAASIGASGAVVGWGDEMDDPRLRVMALHEVGHCLGMHHSDGVVRDDVVSPMVDGRWELEATLRYSAAAARRV